MDQLVCTRMWYSVLYVSVWAVWRIQAGQRLLPCLGSQGGTDRVERDDVARALRDGCARGFLRDGQVSGVTCDVGCGNTGRVAIDVRGRERSRVCVLLPYLRRVLRARTFGGGYLLGECGAVLA